MKQTELQENICHESKERKIELAVEENDKTENKSHILSIPKRTKQSRKTRTKMISSLPGGCTAAEG